MKTRVRHLALFVLLGLFLCPPLAAQAFSPPADSLHFCAFDDYERWRRDHPRPAAKRAATLNVGQPRTVRMIYFLPNDRPYRDEAVSVMKDRIRKAQAFFAEQMQAHGYGNMTFRFESDAQGEPLVHRVDGQHPASHYNKSNFWSEIEKMFDLHANIYVLKRDIRDGDGGAYGTRIGKNGGYVSMPGDTLTRGWDWTFTAHELGHAFGLGHDFRDDVYILSYGLSLRSSLSACTAEFLSVHPYFNSAIPIEESSPPTIELISPTEYPGGSKNVSIRFEVGDGEGLHQVLLYASPAYGYGGLRECRAFEGQRDAVVEFEYDGSSMAADPARAITSLSDSLHLVQARVVDTDGNMSAIRFDLTADHVTDALKGHTDSVNAVAFSPDGATLASGSSDGTVKLWDASRREFLATLEGHAYPVRAVAFSRDGTLASASWNDAIKLWDVTTQKETATLEGIAPLAFSRDGSVLASGSDNRRITLWDVRTLEKIATFEGHTEQINTVAFSPDGSLLASGSGFFDSEDQTVRLWDVDRREQIATFSEQTGAIWSVAFSPDGAILASAVGLPNNRLRLWDVRTHREVARLWRGPGGPYLSVAFSPGGAILASGLGDGTVKLWDALTRENIGTFLPVQPFRGFESGVRSVAISPDGTTLAYGLRDHTIRLRDVSKWTGLRPFAIEILSGAGQQGAPGATLSQPLVVEVYDRHGNPVPGATVSFAVTAGGATLSVTTATTDANGRAATMLTLGPQPGTNSVVATIADLKPVTFTATAGAMEDFDGDGTVGFADFVQFAAQFGQNQADEGFEARYDLDGNGAIGFSDFVILAQAFGKNISSG